MKEDKAKIILNLGVEKKKKILKEEEERKEGRKEDEQFVNVDIISQKSLIY